MARPSLLRTLCALSVFSRPILGHMQMSDPSPLRDPHSNRAEEPKDYNILMPLKADGSDFTCKGYQWNTPLTPVATYNAGQTYTMTLMGGATHGGGSCQISLSCNQGVDFKVLKSIIGGCPEEKEYDFTIPQNAATAQCLLSWSWFNRVGNREMYQNCAVVNIVGSKGSKKATQSDAQAALSRLPDMYVANLKGINGCSTKETVDVVFDDPGDAVMYGKDVKPRPRFAPRANVEACAGVGRKAAGGSVSIAMSPVSSLSSVPSNKPAGDDGQWHGEGTNKVNPDGSSRTSSSALSCNQKIKDGMWHPDCFGKPDSNNQKPIPSDTGKSSSKATTSVLKQPPASTSHKDTVSATSVPAPKDSARLKDIDDFEDYHPTIAASKHMKSQHGSSQSYDDNGEDEETDDDDYYYDYGFYRQALRTRELPGDGSEEPTVVPGAGTTPPSEDSAPFAVVSNGTSTWMEIQHKSTVITEPIPLESDVYDSDGFLVLAMDPFAADGEDVYIFAEPLTTSALQAIAPSTARGTELPIETGVVANNDNFNKDNGLVGHDPSLDTEDIDTPGDSTSTPSDVAADPAAPFTYSPSESTEAGSEAYDEDGTPFPNSSSDVAGSFPIAYQRNGASLHEPSEYPKLPKNWLQKNPHHSLESGVSTTADALRIVADDTSCQASLQDSLSKRATSEDLGQPNVELPKGIIASIWTTLSPEQVWKAQDLLDAAQSSSLTTQQVNEAKTLVDDFAARSGSLSLDQIAMVKNFIDNYAAPHTPNENLKKRGTLAGLLANSPIPSSEDELEFLKAVYLDYAASQNPEKELNPEFVKTLFRDRDTAGERSLGKRQGASPWSSLWSAKPTSKPGAYTTQSAYEDVSKSYGPDDDSADSYGNKSPYSYYDAPPNLPPYAYSYDQDGEEDAFAILLDTPSGGLPDEYAKYAEHSPKEDDYPDIISEWWPKYKDHGENSDCEAESGDEYDDTKGDSEEYAPKGGWRRSAHVVRDDEPTSTIEDTYPYSPYPDFNPVPSIFSEAPESTSTSYPADPESDTDDETDTGDNNDSEGIDNGYPGPYNYYDPPENLPPYAYSYDQDGKPDGYAILLDTPTGGLPDPYKHSPKEGDYPDEVKDWQDAKDKGGEDSDDMDWQYPKDDEEDDGDKSAYPSGNDGSEEYEKLRFIKRQDFRSWTGDGIEAVTENFDESEDAPSDSWYDDLPENVERPEAGSINGATAEGDDWFSSLAPELKDVPTDVDSEAGDGVDDIDANDLAELFYGEERERSTKKRQEDDSLLSDGGDGIDYDPSALFPSLSESYGADGNGGDTPDVDTSSVKDTNVTTVAEPSRDLAGTVSEPVDEDVETADYYQKRQELDFPSVSGGDGIDFDPETIFPDLPSSYGAEGNGGDAVDEAAARVGDDSAQASTNDTFATSKVEAPVESRRRKRQELSFPSVAGGDGIDADPEDMFPGMQDQDAEGWVPPTQLPGAYASTSDTPATKQVKKPAKIAFEDDDAAPTATDTVKTPKKPKTHTSHSKKPLKETTSDGSQGTGNSPKGVNLSLLPSLNATLSSSSIPVSTPTSFIWPDSSTAAVSSVVPVTSIPAPSVAVSTPVLATDIFWAVSLLPKPTVAVAPARIAEPSDSLEGTDILPPSPSLTNATSVVNTTASDTTDDSDWGVEGVDWTWDDSSDVTDAVGATSASPAPIPTLPTIPPFGPDDGMATDALPTGLPGLPAPTGPVVPLLTGFGKAAAAVPTGGTIPVEPITSGFGKSAPSLPAGPGVPAELPAGIGKPDIPLPPKVPPSLPTGVAHSPGVPSGWNPDSPLSALIPSSVLPYIFGPGPVVPEGKSFSMPIPAGLKHLPTGLPASLPGVPSVPTRLPTPLGPIVGHKATATLTILTTIESTFTTIARQMFTTIPLPTTLPSAKLGPLLFSIQSEVSASRSSSQLAQLKGHVTTSRRIPVPFATAAGFRNITSSLVSFPTAVASRSSIDLGPPALGAPTVSIGVITTPLVNPLRPTTFSTLSTPSLATDILWAVTSTSLAGPLATIGLPTFDEGVLRRSASFDADSTESGEDVNNKVHFGAHAGGCHGGEADIRVMGIMRGSSKASDVREGVEEKDVQELRVK